jgi:hypothetical protein
MTKTKTCYGSDVELSYEEQTKMASAMYAYMKTLPDWNEDYIALFTHKSNKFVVDCNSDTTIVFKAGDDGEFYFGSDGFHALISDVDGINEWLGDEGL